MAIPGWLCAHLGGLTCSDAQQIVVARREDAVRVTAGGPHDVVVQECDVDDGAQWLRMTDGGNAACGL